jgi:carbon starvation protein
MSLIAILATIVIVALGYRFYASKMDREVMQTDAKRATPATMYNDGVDFTPASSSVLFGYQFKSIAALGPIVGPITALQFGWLPSILWLIIGVFFIGWVQDYASALLSMRNEGMTMGGLSYKLISPRARTLLLSFMYLYLLLIMGAFGSIIAPLLGGTNVPIGFIAIVLGGLEAGPAADHGGERGYRAGRRVGRKPAGNLLRADRDRGLDQSPGGRSGDGRL